MKRLFLYICLIITCSTAFLSCRDEGSELGKRYVETSLRNVLTDTCTVKMSTILVDSIETSGNSTFQLGHYYDPAWGDLSLSYYTEYNMPSLTKSDNTYIFDSITVKFYCDGTYLGDTLSRQSVHIYNLAENINLNYYGYLYSTSEVKREDTPLTTITFDPRPNWGKEIECRLPDEFGEQFLDMVLNYSIYLDSQDKFRDYFHGLAFIPDGDDSCITGFAVSDTSMCLTIYYTRIDSYANEEEMVMTPYTTRSFNKVDYDRTGTPLESIEPGVLLAEPSENTDNKTYILGMAGMYTKIEFPYLNDLQKLGDLVSIEAAYLYLYPVHQSFGDLRPLPQELTLFTADETNSAEEQITNSSGTQVQNGSLTDDRSTYNGTYYTFDITTFLQTNLGALGINQRNLLLTVPTEDLITTCSSVMFGDKNNPNGTVELDILFKIYTKE
ncbi:MAG: DUF4270 domain-containing protein [Bacteroides sp.]|nr:DUF4270 domain-containing protein [Bacteroides sp.]